MEKTITKTKSMVFAALFAALACVATMSLHIPTPGPGGDIHPGDAVIVAAGYCFFEYFMYGSGAFASVPANLIQGLSGLIISTILLPLLKQVPDFRSII